MLRTTTGIMGIALLLAACGGGDDDGSDHDAGGTDPCVSDGGIPNPGCNGWASGDPMPNELYGTCTPAADPMMMPQGSCTTPNAVCVPAGAEMRICAVRCPRAATYISTGGCPRGFRCFTVGDEMGWCVRDCDAMHPCPTGFRCDVEGRCLPPSG
jgi:hypothetical protein